MPLHEVATRHLRLGRHLKQTDPGPINRSCIGGQPGPIEQMVEWLGQQVHTLFLASGFCEDTELVILGMSLANMAFVLLVAALATVVWALWRGWRPSHS